MIRSIKFRQNPLQFFDYLKIIAALLDQFFLRGQVQTQSQISPS